MRKQTGLPKISGAVAAVTYSRKKQFPYVCKANRLKNKQVIKSAVPIANHLFHLMPIPARVTPIFRSITFMTRRLLKAGLRPQAIEMHIRMEFAAEYIKLKRTTFTTRPRAKVKPKMTVTNATAFFSQAEPTTPKELLFSKAWCVNAQGKLVRMFIHDRRSL